MFVKVLDCPECSHRFQFEHTTEDFPPRITCPSCQVSNAYSDFSALTFCPQCRAKLKVPLDIINDPDVSCPECGTVLNANATYLEDADASTLTAHGDRRQQFRRMLQDGEIFDKYQIVRLLGKGGMAEVYLAEHLLLKQKCALKLMRSGMESDDPIYVKRFLREAKLSHQFNHPNIVKVFDVGSDFKTGYLFIAMEYVEGKTLLELAREKSLSEDELKIVLVSMANALNSLAEARVVHRDIKPSNIMLDSNGVYKLMDLGIAKSESNHQSGEMTLTMEQSTIGTPSYASPEQCQSAHKVDIRSDIYSLGATIYHAASGKLPFDGNTAVETILKVLQTEAIPLKSHRPDLSNKLLDLVERMMRKNPLDRPASPDEILAELYRADEGFTGNVKRKIRKYSGNCFKWLLPSKEVPLRKYIMRLLRAVIAAVLLVVIVVNFRHILNYYKVKKEQERKAAAPLVKKLLLADLIKTKQPLMKYPDAAGEFSARRNRNNTAFAQVKLYKPAAGSKVFEYDFDKNRPPENRFAPELIQNGMFLMGLREYTDPQRPKYKRLRNSYIYCDENLQSYTLAINFQLKDQVDCTFMNVGFISMGVYQNRLCFLVDNQYYISTEMTIPTGSWANVLLSCDGAKRKFSVYSGDRLIGSYILHRQNNFMHDVTFSVRGYGQSLNCNIDYLALYDTALKVDLPEQSQANYLAPHVSSSRMPDKVPYWVAPKTKKTNQSTVAVPQVSQAPPVAVPAKTPESVPEKTAAPAQPAPAAPAAPAKVVAAFTPTSPDGATSGNSDSLQDQWQQVLRRINQANNDLAAAGSANMLGEQLKNARSYRQQFAEYYKQTQAGRGKHIAGMSSNQIRLYNEILARRGKLLKEWEDRIKYIEKRNAFVQETSARQYSSSANAKVQQEFQEHTRRRTDWGYNNSDIEFSKKLQAMLKDPQVDPNLSLTDATYNEYSGPAIYAVSSGRIQQMDELFDILIQRGADPTGLLKSDGRATRVSNRLIDYGLPALLTQKYLDIIFNTSSKLQPSQEKSARTLFFDGAKFKVQHLYKAVLDNNRNLVLMLLAAGVDPNAQNSNGETPLFNAYRTTNSESIRELLLAAGADANITDNHGKRPHDYADIGRFTGYWEKNNIAMCRKMLREKFDANTMLSNGRTLLTSACSQGSYAKVKMLLDFKADASARDKRGYSPLQTVYDNLRNYSYRYRQMSSAQHREWMNIIKDLLRAGADLRENPPHYGGASLNIFRYTIENMSSTPEGQDLISFMLPYTEKFTAEHWRSVPYILNDAKNLPVNIKQTVFQAMNKEVLQKNLHYALASGCKFSQKQLQDLIIPQMVNKFFYLNINTSRKQATMLHAAIYGKQDVNTLRAILAAGGDPFWRNNQQESALDIAHSAAVRDLLKTYRPAVDAEAPPPPGKKNLTPAEKSNLQTKLQQAVEKRDVQQVKELLDRGADCYEVNSKGYNLLQMACDTGQIELVKLLIQRDVDIHRVENYTPYNRNSSFSTALHPMEIAVQHLNPEILKELYLKSPSSERQPSGLILARRSVFRFAHYTAKQKDNIKDLENKTIEIIKIIEQYDRSFRKQVFPTGAMFYMSMLARRNPNAGEKLMEFILSMAPTRPIPSHYVGRFPPGKLRTMLEEHMKQYGQTSSRSPRSPRAPVSHRTQRSEN